jgi:predicted GIY-YIG superfamily endonuclease
MSIHSTYFTEFSNINDTYRECVKNIIQLKKTRLHYIGATNNPEERIDRHIEEKKMKNMYLLTKTRNKIQAEKLEKKLIERFKRESNSNKCINQSGGGEGIIEGENYIYLLLK